MDRLLRSLSALGSAVKAATGYSKPVIVKLHELHEMGMPEPEQSGPRAKKAPYFSIRRTKSDAGLLYWILEGFGPYQCYILCDTWSEAMEQARIRQIEVDGGIAEGRLQAEPVVI